MACELILALDVPDRDSAREILGEVRGSIRWVKIGLQMFTAYGPAWVEEVAASGFKIFLDLKLHDIPHTVARAVDSLAPLPIGMLTLHAAGGSEMLAAAQSRARPDLLLLGVTVLTSMNEAGLAEIGVNASPSAQVERLARVALGAGLNGLVCSPLEIETLRRVSRAVNLITPGIRLENEPGRAGDDQKRVMTPAAAAAAGANYLVVGRPILQAADRGAFAQQIARSLVP